MRRLAVATAGVLAMALPAMPPTAQAEARSHSAKATRRPARRRGRRRLGLRQAQRTDHHRRRAEVTHDIAGRALPKAAKRYVPTQSSLLRDKGVFEAISH